MTNTQHFKLQLDAKIKHQEECLNQPNCDDKKAQYHLGALHSLQDIKRYVEINTLVDGVRDRDEV